MIGWLIGSCTTLLIYTLIVGFTYTHPYKPASTSAQILDYLKSSAIPSQTTTQGQSTTISFEIPESSWSTVSSRLKPLLNPQTTISLGQTLLPESRTISITIKDK